MEQIYLKVKGGQELAYTSLNGLLRSEGIERAYRSVRSRLLRGEKYIFGNIVISKVKLNHFTHGKRTD